MTTNFVFESKPCSRCGGSGRYSYCSMYGSTCFKCAGHGAVLTKRGAAANAYFQASASKPAGEFRVGEHIRLTGVTMGGATYNAFEKVTAVKVDGEKCIIETVNKRGELCALHTSTASVYRQALTAERKRELIAAALEYQATLTQAGKPRARRIATEAA